MGKLKKAIKAFQMIAKRPSLLNLVIEYEENFKSEVISKYNLPSGLPRLHFDEFLKEVNTVEPFTFLEGGSLPTDYLLLAALSKKIQGTCFEIGTWRGESALNMARFAKHMYTLNLGKEELKEMGFDEAYGDMQGSMCKGNEHITQLWGNSLSFDFSDYKGRCDLVFVDGDHHFASVVNDTKIAFDLIRDEDKSVIVWHDYGNGTETTRWEVLLGILGGTPPEKRKHLYAVNNTLCAVYYPYPVESFTARFPQAPKNIYKVTIDKG